MTCINEIDSSDEMYTYHHLLAICEDIWRHLETHPKAEIMGNAAISGANAIADEMGYDLPCCLPNLARLTR
jgi:hypothetical protein